MDCEKWLRKHLQRIVAAAQGDEISTGFWVGDKAAERAVMDNLQVRRIHFQTAREGARRGLEALENGDIEYAKKALRECQLLGAAAIEAQLKPSQRKALSKDAALRGAKGKGDRDKRLAVAIAEQEVLGLKNKAARHAAFRANPTLADEYKDLGEAGVRAAIKRGKSKL